MEFLLIIFTLLCLVLILFFVLKPKMQPKTKEQKQEELRQNYHTRLHEALKDLEDQTFRQEKKIALLKIFAKELEHNLFFDNNEVKMLIQELAKY